MTVAASGAPRCFLDLADHEPAELRRILDTAAALKTARAGLPQGAPDPEAHARARVLALVFEQPSTRTRVSFDVGMRQMGGETLFLSGEELQLGRGETVADTARVLSRYVDAIMVRTLSHEDLIDLAEAAEVPVINGLTKRSHPCQIMADILTFEERLGRIEGRTVAWFGDSNNVSTSWIHAAALFDFTFRFAGPREFHPPADLVAWARERGANIELTTEAEAAAEGADCLITDTWVSLGDSKTASRLNKLAPYQVTEALMNRAAPQAVFMHCLPAHRGQEMTAAVLDGPRSAVWDEAENRLHAQKGILAWCFGA